MTFCTSDQILGAVPARTNETHRYRETATAASPLVAFLLLGRAYGRSGIRPGPLPRQRRGRVRGTGFWGTGVLEGATGGSVVPGRSGSELRQLLFPARAGGERVCLHRPTRFGRRL